MELRVLRYFLAVAQEETISGAADILHVTQPTLSRQLMELEEELGTKLFMRGNRKITLTDKGILLRKRAEEIIDLAQKTEAEFLIQGEAISGDVYIGGGETHAMKIIASAIKDLQQNYPDIRYHFYSGNAEDVTERLDKGLLDFGVLIEPANLAKYDFIPLPAVDVWGLLMRKDSPLAFLNEIQPENLWDIPLIASRQRLVSNSIETWIKKDYEKLNVVATYNLIYNASLMVEEGIGYALALDGLINTTGNSNLCFRPLSPKLEVGLDIVWKKYQVFSKPAETFLDKIQSIFQV